ncbi:hypothetical protein EHQ12_03440 [Leptospira gomenensis]|uniref:Uncharacterized protein n=1 Tax=Leptospira gomenensis TaxID=2484974 RepID=A0A5F1Y8B1_9LEPT|nr:hypothetical protein [Leptospira gomenensis]TGK31112.1 hypothetical protein EHQ17_15475 [Leptospira gomenensis]TGK43316.1 hypothetical protein EHQ12_03440 [Leptospira gomenensis]TGK45169.1 hypothetical protein EHQ07_09525 [Leptospira gomenensis]TGK66083.1 hypothetical protein EHQ13_03260 [Leptospira gomenensis]
MNPRSESDEFVSRYREILSRLYAKAELYCVASGIKDPILTHSELSEFINQLRIRAEHEFPQRQNDKTSSRKTKLAVFSEDERKLEEEWMRLFLESGIGNVKRNEAPELPMIEPARMIPNPVDFGTLGELAEPKENLEPVAIVFSVLFWTAVYSFLLYGLLR